MKSWDMPASFQMLLAFGAFDACISAESAKRELETNTGKLRLVEQERIAARKLRIQLDSAQMELQRQQEELLATKAMQDQEKANLELLREAGKLLKKDEDPTLGTIIADMGHKIIYKADPISLLAQTKVWRKQRAFRPVSSSYISVLYAQYVCVYIMCMVS
jgi:hypothetical protein